MRRIGFEQLAHRRVRLWGLEHLRRVADHEPGVQPRQERHLLLAGRAGVERGGDRSQLRHPVQQHRVLDRRFRDERDAIASLYPEAGEPASRADRLAVKVGERDLAVAGDQRRLARHPLSGP